MSNVSSFLNSFLPSLNGLFIFLELELVENAAFTDPNDQSAWFYLRWLLGRLQPPLKAVVLSGTNGGRLCAAFNRSVKFCDQDIKEEGVNASVDCIPQAKWMSLCYTHDAGNHSSKAWVRLRSLFFKTIFFFYLFYFM